LLLVLELVVVLCYLVLLFNHELIMTRDLNQCPHVMLSLMVTVVVMELFKFTFLILSL